MTVIDDIVKNDTDNTSVSISLPDDTLMFDIETTGFSPKTSHLYLIGAVYAQNGQIMLKQWFAETPEAEAAVISAFFDFLGSFRCVCGYNITGFDMPYLLGRTVQCGISGSFDRFECIDFFHEIKRFAKLLKLADYKQKTVEHFLGIERADKYSGKELIKVYENYLNAPSKGAAELLLLHNADDVRGLLRLTPMREYRQIPDMSFELQALDIDESCAVFTLRLNRPVPVRASCGCDAYYMTCSRDTLKIRCSIYSGELKYFYSNYKDYYYLPVEDYAIHKSVASYVDKSFRTKAKAVNCYIKKTGIFLPQKEEIVSPCFKSDYYDRTTYFEADGIFRDDSSLQLKYISHIIKLLLG